MSYYANLLHEREEWSPAALPQEPFRSQEHGVPETIERCLALALALELPVGAFIGAATRSDLPVEKAAIDLLKSNIADETRHDRAFNLAAQVYPVRPAVQEDANNLRDLWETHPDHTILKAGTLELGVFMVSLGLLRWFGGQSLDRMAAYVSLDEYRHVNTNWSLIEELELTPAPTLDPLRKTTLSWLVEKLTFPNQDQAFWIRQGESLIKDQEAPEMEFLFWNPHISFFEIDNRHLGGYALES